MKYKIMAVAALVTVSSFADFTINWKSENSKVGNQPGTGLLVDGTYAALIWSATAPSSAAVLTLAGISDSGSEILLDWTTDTIGGGFTESGATYNNLSVGLVNTINSGYFFTRIFDTAVLSDNNFYVQGQVVGPSLVDAGSPANPALVYDQKVFGAGSSDGAFGQVNTTYTVIPEPATFGLMGIAGLGMFLARRKNRR